MTSEHDVLHRIEVWDGEELLGSIIPDWDGGRPYRLSSHCHEDLRSWWTAARMHEWGGFDGDPEGDPERVVDGVQEIPPSELDPEDLVGFLRQATEWHVVEIKAPR